MNIISFSGVDGSGKSTQTKLIKKFFEDQGQQVAYFHATEYSLANRVARKAKGQDDFTPGDAPAVTQGNIFTALGRLVFLLVDAVRFFFYRRQLEKKGVQVLISDRFFQDSLMNVAYLSNNFLIYLGIKMAAWMVPKPDQSFYLKLAAEDIASRERLPEQGMDYLQKKIALYDYPPFAWSTHVLDATLPPEVICQEVVSYLAL